MIKEITKFISVELGLTIGTNIWAGFAPIDAGDGSVIIETGGPPDFYLPDQIAKSVQVLSRAKDYYVARDQAKRIYELLHGKSGITLPVVTPGEAYVVNTSQALSGPQSLGQDEKGRFVISTNFVIRIRNAN